VEYNSKVKMKDQNSSGRTDSKKGLAVTKGEGCGRAGENGGRRVLRGIMIGTHGVGDHREDSVEQRRQVVTLRHLTTLMDSDCNEAWRGLDNMGGCSDRSVLSCETFIRVYVNNTLILKNF